MFRLEQRLRLAPIGVKERVRSMSEVEQKIVDLDWQLVNKFITRKYYEQQLLRLTKQLEEGDVEQSTDPSDSTPM